MSATLQDTNVGRPARPLDLKEPDRNEDLPPLRVFLVAEDDRGARNAEALLLRVVPQEPCAVANCQFDELESESRFQTTTDAAAEADLLVLSRSRGGELPSLVKSWLRRWVSLRDPGRDGALVALLNGDNGLEDPFAVRLYLETVAILAGVKFFVARVLRPGQVVDWSLPSEQLDRQTASAEWDAEAAADPSVPLHAWGINE